jgi:flagellar motor component MotA
MFAIVGIVLVFGAVLGGFLMEKGHIEVLIQPAEMLIIVGAATGTLLVANPVHILKGILGGLKGVLAGSKFNKERYLNSLKMMYQFLNKAQRRTAQRGDGCRKAFREWNLQELSGVPSRPSCARFCVRHATHGDHWRC